MKQFIHKSALSLLLLFMATCLASKTNAQCLCGGGEAPTPLEHLVILDTTTASSTLLNFPKFDPSIGTLTCITMHDTVSIVSVLGIRNLDPADKNYSFRLTITTSLNGATPASPAMSRGNFFDKMYGPNLLGASGSATDSITYGPDTLYDNFPSYTVNTSNMVPFMGTTGGVVFEYEIGGGVASLAGGINFNSSVRTRTWGAFKLTYYWCPTTMLASGVKNFSAVKKDNQVQLGWQVDEEESKNNYEILVSTDGRKFTSAGRAENGQINGNSTLYNYLFAYNQQGGKLYFRLKQTDGTGKAWYSAIRTVNLSENSNGSFGIYPNPVVRNVSLQFDRELKGNYKIELVNLMGQAIYNRTMQLNNQSQIQLQLNNPPAAGVYYVRVKSTETRQVFTNKVIIRR